MTIFTDPLKLLTPFGMADCYERKDDRHQSYWICFIIETGICFWFLNQEVRHCTDWSDGRYKTLPFDLDKERIAVLDKLGKHHTYWCENIKPGNVVPIRDEIWK